MILVNFIIMEERLILGLTESIIVAGERLIARVDTGAERSSIDKKLAEKLDVTPIGVSKIRSASGQSVRPIIPVDIQICGRKLEGDFTVADRTNMNYKVLIGQDILKKGNFFIDPLKLKKSEADE